jgi:hypothetical protein
MEFAEWAVLLSLAIVVGALIPATIDYVSDWRHKLFLRKMSSYGMPSNEEKERIHERSIY